MNPAFNNSKNRQPQTSFFQQLQSTSADNNCRGRVKKRWLGPINIKKGTAIMTTKPVSTSNPPETSYSLPDHLTGNLGLGYTSIADGVTTAQGLPLEIGLGYRLKLGADTLGFSGFWRHVSLNSPLFGRKDAEDLNVWGGKLDAGFHLSSSSSWHLQFSGGLANYGDIVRNEANYQNGDRIYDTSLGFEFGLGIGPCFWKDRICGILNNRQTLNAIYRYTSPRNGPPKSEVIDTTAVGVMVYVDLFRFF